MATLRARTRRNHALVLVVAVLVSATAIIRTAGAAESSTGRAGAGLRIGSWEVRDLTAPSGGDASETPNYEGWLQKGLDAHLVMESTLGFWQRTQSWSEAGPITGQTDIEVTSYLVPMMTSLKILPVTRASSPLEPYISAGLGIVLAIDKQSVSSTDPTVVDGDDVAFQTGFGVQAGGGLDWNTGTPFGITVGARYQWASFNEDVGGRRMYRGPVFGAGVTYRFQN